MSRIAEKITSIKKKIFPNLKREKTKEILNHLKPLIIGSVRYVGRKVGNGNQFAEQIISSSLESVVSSVMDIDVAKTSPIARDMKAFFGVKNNNEIVDREMGITPLVRPKNFVRMTYQKLNSRTSVSSAVVTTKDSHDYFKIDADTQFKAGQFIYLFCESSEIKFVVGIPVSSSDEFGAMNPYIELKITDEKHWYLVKSVMEKVLLDIAIDTFKGKAYFLKENPLMGAVEAVELSKTRDQFYVMPKVLKSEIDWLSTHVSKVEEYKKAGLKTSYGLFLYGKPGTGKSLFVSAVMERLEDIPILILDSSITSYSTLQQILDVAKGIGIVMIIWDDCENRMIHRNSGGNITDMLTFIDGVQKTSGIINIAMSNLASKIDPAFRRSGRFDRFVEVSKFDPEETEELLRKVMDFYALDYSDARENILSKDYKDNAHIRGVFDLIVKNTLQDSPESKKVTKEIVDRSYDFFSVYDFSLDGDEEDDEEDNLSTNEADSVTLEEEEELHKHILQYLRMRKLNKGEPSLDTAPEMVESLIVEDFYQLGVTNIVI